MKIDELFEQEDVMLYEMANLQPIRTGLPTVIWFGEVGGQHGPRIKVSNTPGKYNTSSNFTITVDKEPKIPKRHEIKISNSDVELIFDWITLNYDLLMCLWKSFETGNAVEVIEGGVVKMLDAHDIISRLQKI